MRQTGNLPLRSSAVSTTFLDSDYTIVLTVAGQTGALPLAPLASDTYELKVVTAPGTLDGNGQLIDGAATFSLTNNGQAVTVRYDGTQWRRSAEASASAGGGGVTSLPLTNVQFVDGVFDTPDSTPTRSGGRFLDLTPYPATIGALTRTIRFKANIETSIITATANVRLHNITDNETVTGTALATTSTSNVEVDSGALTVGVAAGNLKDDRLYEVQIFRTGGVVTDRVAITNARLEVTYA